MRSLNEQRDERLQRFVRGDEKPIVEASHVLSCASGYHTVALKNAYHSAARGDRHAIKRPDRAAPLPLSRHRRPRGKKVEGRDVTDPKPRFEPFHGEVEDLQPATLAARFGSRWPVHESEAVEPPLRRERRDVEAGRQRVAGPGTPPTPRAPQPPASAARRRRRSPRARGCGRCPARRPASDSRSARTRRPCAWQIQWPSSWAIVKRWRRVGVSPLIASDALTRIRRSVGISIPEHSPRSSSSIRRPSRSSAIDSTGTGISSPP